MSLPDFTSPGALDWNAASVELPEMPSIQAGEDAMSMTIAGLLPTMHASLTANITALSAKENMFNAKLSDAQGAYENADQAGQQGVGQLGQMMGQLGQLGQMASGAAQGGGQGGGFSSLMEPLMKAMESATKGGGENGGAPPGAGLLRVRRAVREGRIRNSSRTSGEARLNDRDNQQNEREARQNERDAVQDGREAHLNERESQLNERSTAPPQGAGAGPSENRPSAGPAPVAPPQAPAAPQAPAPQAPTAPVAPHHPPSRHDDGDLSRRM